MRHAKRFVPMVLSALAVTSAYAAEVNQLAPPDVATGDRFGQAVAADGGTVVVGAPYHDQDATDAGSAYVFVARGVFLPLQTELRPSDPEGGAHFGTSVAVSGDTAVVGAPDDGGAGAVYVFERTRGTWAEVAKLTSGTSSDRFGASVAIDGGTAVVGAPGRSSSAGAVFVFVKSGTSWTQQTEIAGSGGALGTSVGVRGDRLVAGAPQASSSRGLAATYTRSGTTWTLETTLQPSDSTDGDETGGAVAIGSTWIAVGAAKADATGATDAGAVHVYGLSGGTWTRSARLFAPSPSAGAAFGSAVALDGGSLAVGSPLGDVGGTDAGAADRFVARGSGWAYLGTLPATGSAAADRHGTSVALAADLVVSGTPGRGGGAAFAQRGDEETKLTAFDGAASDLFGCAIAISGDTAIVGASQDEKGVYLNVGSAYVFVRCGGTWTLQQKLTASDGTAIDWFGYSVALSGDTALVSARLDDDRGDASGSAYVFVRSGSVWTEQQKLTASDGAEGDCLGSSLSLSGDTALVGATGSDVHGSGSGCAYVFVRTGGVWSEQQKLAASDGAAEDGFGGSVALSGATALVGASGDDDRGTDSGSAYVFVRSGGNWTQQSKLTAQNEAEDWHFGSSVALAGDTALVGATGEDRDRGAAYAFVRSGATWTQEQRLVASDAAISDCFGGSVALWGDTALVGAIGDDDRGEGSGSAYVFLRSGRTWTQRQKLTAPDGAAIDFFGESVALCGDTALVAVPHDDDKGDASGSVWLLRLQTTRFDQSEEIAHVTGSYGGSVALTGDTAVVGAIDDYENGLHAGAAFVMVRTAGGWTEQQKLTVTPTVQYERFGADVAFSGETAFVGASGSGSVYVFDRSGGQWTQVQHLGVGSAVAMSGDVAIVGAPMEDAGRTDAGAAYVFVRSGGAWTEAQRLASSDRADYDWFGRDVTISGDTAIVGAPGDDDDGSSSGSVCVYVLSGGTWALQQKLTASDGAAGAQFGSSVALAGDTALIGAPPGGSGAGAAYVFVRTNGQWTEAQKLTASDGVDYDSFGRSVALSADVAVVGASCQGGTPLQNNLGPGYAYVFRRGLAGWTQRQKLMAQDGASYELFGSSVALAGDTALVGASGRGSVFAFEEHGSRPLASWGSVPTEWTVGAPMSRSCSVSGGTAPLHWIVATGALPTGLALDGSTGAVTGTPSAQGTFRFTVECSDAWGAASTASGAIVIHAPPAVTTESLPASTEDRPYRQTLGVSGGTSPITWSLASGTLPVTGTLGAATGILDGTSKSAGTYTFAARVTDAAGATASRTFAVKLNPWPQIAAANLPLACWNRAYDAGPGVADGTAPFQWAITAGGLPPGLALDPITGHLTGTPTTLGRTTIEFQVTDAAGAVATRSYPLVVVPRCDLAKAKLTEKHDLAAGQGGADIVRFVELLGGTDVDISMSVKTKSGAGVALALLDAAEQPIDLAPYTKARKSTTSVKNFPVPSTGRYFLALRPDAAFEGSIKLSVAASATKTWTGGGTLDAAGAPLVLDFCALPGSTLVVTTKASKKSPALPTIGGLADEDGTELLVPAELKESKTGATLKARTPLAGGDYRLTIAPREGSSAGAVEWTVQVKSPKGYVFELPDVAVGGE